MAIPDSRSVHSIFTSAMGSRTTWQTAQHMVHGLLSDDSSCYGLHLETQSQTNSNDNMKGPIIFC